MVSSQTLSLDALGVAVKHTSGLHQVAAAVKWMLDGGGPTVDAEVAALAEQVVRQAARGSPFELETLVDAARSAHVRADSFARERLDSAFLGLLDQRNRLEEVRDAGHPALGSQELEGLARFDLMLDEADSWFEDIEEVRLDRGEALGQEDRRWWAPATLLAGIPDIVAVSDGAAAARVAAEPELTEGLRVVSFEDGSACVYSEFAPEARVREAASGEGGWVDPSPPGAQVVLENDALRVLLTDLPEQQQAPGAPAGRQRLTVVLKRQGSTTLGPVDLATADGRRLAPVWPRIDEPKLWVADINPDDRAQILLNVPAHGTVCQLIFRRGRGEVE